MADGERKAAMVAYRLRNTVSENGHVTRGLCEADANGFLTRVIETYMIMPFGDGTIRSIDGCEEGRILDPEAAISMNFWCFTPAMMQQLACELHAFLHKDDHAHSLTAELTLPEVVDDWVKRGELSADMLQTEAVWFGVTYREDKPIVIAELEKLHAKQQYPKKLNQ